MSGKLKVSDMLARAFAAEGVDHLFTLMGDANMYWSTAMAEMPGMKVWHARHEHCAVAMADGYARAAGKVGVASTTCGPGFTQIMTALTIAARGNVIMADQATITGSIGVFGLQFNYEELAAKSTDDLRKLFKKYDVKGLNECSERITLREDRTGSGKASHASVFADRFRHAQFDAAGGAGFGGELRQIAAHVQPTA